MFLSHINLSLPLSLSPSARSSLSKINKKHTRVRLKKKKELRGKIIQKLNWTYIGGRVIRIKTSLL